MQRILVIGGMLFLGTLMLLFFGARSRHIEITLSDQALLTGTGIGQSITEEISAKSFDELTVSSAINDVNLLTNPASLGKDAGESSYPQFDDVDDYYGHTRIYNMGILGEFKDSVAVYYVSDNNPDQKSYNRSFLKRIDVFVTNIYLEREIKFSQLISY